MKALLRGFGLALLTMAFLGLTGCGADNETEADRLQKGAGAAPATDIKGADAVPQAKDLAEYAKQKQGQDPYATFKKKK